MQMMKIRQEQLQLTGSGNMKLVKMKMKLTKMTKLIPIMQNN